MKRGILTIVAAFLSGLYWFVFFLFAETWTASDYRAGTEPGDGWLTAKVALVFLAGPLIFAVLIAGWRRLETAMPGSR